jgi:hypothetical protein
VTAVSDIVDKVLARRILRRRIPTYREFAGTIALPGGLLKGQRYQPTSDPWQDYIITQLDSGRWERFYDCGSPQVAGKTLLYILTVALRTVIAERLPVGYGLPTLQDLDKAWHTKLKPALDKSGYKDHLPASGPGSRGGRGPTLLLTDPETGEAEGQIVFLAGGAYGDTVARALIDEIDQFRNADGEPLWGAIEDIYARCDSYGRRALRAGVGTVENDTASIILPLVLEHGTGTRGWPRCPHCGTHRIIGLPDLRYHGDDEQTVRESARIACACGALWTEDDRQAALRGMLFVHRGQDVKDGQVVGPEPRTTALGTLRPALESTLADLREFAVKHFLAKQALDRRGDHGPMRKFVRYQLCQCYTGDKDEAGAGIELTEAGLLERARACTWGPTKADTDKAPEVDGHLYSRHIAPEPTDPGVVGCVAGVDMQGNRCYWVLAAYALDGTSWDVAWGYEHARRDRAPWNQAELFSMLDRVDGVAHQCAGTLPFELGFVDIADGEMTANLNAWLSGRKLVWKGASGAKRRMQADHADDIEGVAYYRDGVWLLDVDSLREQVHAAYRRPNGTIGAIHLPNGLQQNASDVAYIRHLLGQRPVRNAKTGKVTIAERGRHDWLDARRMAHAAMRIRLTSGNRPPPVKMSADQWFKRARR